MLHRIFVDCDAGPDRLLRRIEKRPSDLPTAWKLQGLHVRTCCVSVELSRRDRLNMSLSICHLFNAPDVCPQT